MATHGRFVFILLLAIFSAAISQEIEPEHQAHSKPGGPYFAVDWDGDGSEPLRLDATESHTHFFDLGPPVVSGSIESYEWFSVRTGNSLLRTSSPYLSARFFVGYTVLILVVSDNTGDQNAAYTYVAVREPFESEKVPPTIRQIKPDKGPTYGGGVVEIRGTGFYNNPVVQFGNVEVRPKVLNDTRIEVRVPPSSVSKTVPVRITTGFGTSSRSVDYKYVVSSDNPIKFAKANVRYSTGEDYSIPEVTSITLGPDGLYYAGTLNGFIHVLRIDRTLVVRGACQSHNAGRRRSVLGLTFNPKDIGRPVRLYVSTSTLYWKSKHANASWDNGKVEIWQKDSPSDCLSHFKDVITRLPVSAHDHAVNGLLFDSHGSLFVAVGGTTNAGVHLYEDRLGGVAESPLSGAILRFNLSDPHFDGDIVYLGRPDPGIANVYSGSVEVFCAGLRNVFGMVRHSNGKLYGLDNGPNNGFGLAATGCNTVGRQVAFSDKLVHLKKDAYYGHPNWNRGRFDSRQCSYVGGDAPDKEPSYTAPMAVLSSSTNGIIEYTANTFNSKLRGHLLLSKLSWNGSGSLKKAKLDSTGRKLDDEPEELFSESGLSIVMGPYGELLMPKVKQSKIVGLVPDESIIADIHVIAVMPRIGPASGGNTVMITGYGFGAGLKIFFGSQECLAYGDAAADGTSVQCMVPPMHLPARSVSVVAVRGIFKSATAGSDYEYIEG